MISYNICIFKTFKHKIVYCNSNKNVNKQLILRVNTRTKYFGSKIVLNILTCIIIQYNITVSYHFVVHVNVYEYRYYKLL